MRQPVYRGAALTLPLAAIIQACPTIASAQTDSAWTQHAFQYQYQIIGEYERRWNERRADSRLNPGNIAQLRADANEARFYPAADVTAGPVKLRGDFKLDWQPYGLTLRDSSIRTVGEIQELRAGVALGEAAYLVVGRQRLAWGTGLVWNPTRIEPQKDPFRLTNRLRGADAARFEYTFPGGASANVLFLPAQLSRPSAVAARIETSVLGVSTSASVVSPGTDRWQVGWDATTAFDHITLYGEGAVRGRALRPWLDSTGTPRARAPAKGLASLYHDIVAGSLLTLVPRTQFVVEYRYQSDYSTPGEDDVFLRFLPRNSDLYDPLGRGRHRLYLSGHYGDPGAGGPSLGAFLDPATHQYIFMPGAGLTTGRFKLDLTGFAFHDRAPVSVFRRQLQCILSAYY